MIFTEDFNVLNTSIYTLVAQPPTAKYKQVLLIPTSTLIGLGLPGGIQHIVSHQ